MSKTRKRNKSKNKKSNKTSSLYWGIAGVLFVAVVIVIAQSQSPSGQVTVEGERPAWQTIALTDARSGETFTLSDFNDRNVFVKIMSPF